MDFSQMTQKTREAMSEAQDLAMRMSHQEVDGEHELETSIARSLIEKGAGEGCVIHVDVKDDRLQVTRQKLLAG